MRAVLQPHSASGVDLNLVGRYPLGKRFEITAQLGAFAWKADYTVSNSRGDFLKRDDNGLNLTYGAGLEYGLDGGLGVHGRLDALQDRQRVHRFSRSRLAIPLALSHYGGAEGRLQPRPFRRSTIDARKKYCAWGFTVGAGP